MEYDPSKTAAYLAGKLDEYVKQQARDTIMRNVERDRAARYARIPDGKACDFCKMLGSRGFVYHSEEKAGGKGNKYHPFCNCQIAVSFDPDGFGAKVVQPGRDGSRRLRGYDPDALYREYRQAGQNYNQGSKYKDYPKTAERLSIAGNSVSWVNDSVAHFRTPDEVAAFLERNHGIEVSDSFKGLPIEIQRGVAAGIDNAVLKYGKAAIERIDIRNSKVIEGWYSPSTGTVYINPKVVDAYVTAFHETLHGIDAERSASMVLPEYLSADEMYNIFSNIVMRDAARKVGIGFETSAYYDELAWFYGIDERLEKEFMNPAEAMAYIIEFDEAGRGNKFSKAIISVLSEVL